MNESSENVRQFNDTDIVGVIGETIMDASDQYPSFPFVNTENAWDVAREIYKRLLDNDVWEEPVSIIENSLFTKTPIELIERLQEISSYLVSRLNSSIEVKAAMVQLLKNSQAQAVCITAYNCAQKRLNELLSAVQSQTASKEDKEECEVLNLILSKLHIETLSSNEASNDKFAENNLLWLPRIKTVNCVTEESMKKIAVKSTHQQAIEFVQSFNIKADKKAICEATKKIAKQIDKLSKVKNKK